MAITWTDISAISWLANGEAATAAVFNRPTIQLGDNTDWLRDRLLQEHNSDGTHQPAGVLSSLTGAITNLHINSAASIAESKLSLALLAKPRPGGGTYSDTGQLADDIYAGIRVDNLYDAAVVTPLNGQVLEYESASSTWKNTTPPMGITDHGLLSGRDDDDHSIYILTSGTRVLSGNQSMGTHRLTNLAAPIDANDAVRKADLDAALAGWDWQESVLTRQNDPPGSPSNDDRYLIGSTPTGAWVGHAHQIAEYQGGWQYTSQSEGQAVWVENANDLWVYNGSAFVQFSNLSIASYVADSDGDTRIRLEAAADEDMIRFECAGTEVAYCSSTGLYASGMLSIANATGPSKLSVSETVAGSHHGYATFGIANHWSLGKDVTDDDFVIKQTADFASGGAVTSSNLRIQNSTGYIGINNDNPSEMMDMHGDGADTYVLLKSNVDHMNCFGVFAHGSTGASPSAVDNDEYLGGYMFGGYDGTQWKLGAYIYAKATEDWTGSSHATELRLYALGSGESMSHHSYVEQTETFCISKDGIRIGTAVADPWISDIVSVFSGAAWPNDDVTLATTAAISAYINTAGVLTWGQGTFGLNVTILDASAHNSVWKTNNTSATSIDRVANADNGQWVLIMADDDNTTIESVGSWPPPALDYIFLQGGQAFAMKRGDTVLLAQVDGYMVEFSRSLNG